MRTTFNCGMGLMVIIKNTDAHQAKAKLEEMGYATQTLGIIKNKHKDEPHVCWD
jgi:phosphoribosylaminoimidazole (AIR) synthetase